MIYVIWNEEREAYRTNDGFTFDAARAELYWPVDAAVKACGDNDTAVLIEPPYPIDWLAERLTETKPT